MLVVYEPVPPDEDEAARALTDVVLTAGGVRLGVIENSNANADFILHGIAEAVVAEIGGEIEWAHKRMAGEAVLPEDLDRLVQSCAVILAGTAD